MEERIDTANANCRELLDVLLAQGVETIVLSPGSRNAPLLIGAAARDGLRKLMVNDERTAAFVALGIGMVSQRPVALACTSGTALYNYAPAIAEAFYQHIPLIVITADRPSQWIDQDDSQTLRQPGALDKIVKRSFDIPVETGMTAPCANKSYKTEREWFVNRIANEAILTATDSMPGPVHINMQFGAPLNETIPYKETSPRIIQREPCARELPMHRLREVAQELMTRKVMVVAGFMPPDNKLNHALSRFSLLPNVTVMCETLSNLHLEDSSHMVDSLLVRMNREERERLKPDVVISIGGSLVSRMLKDYLRGCEGAEHWTLGDADVSTDCFQRLTRHFDASPMKFFNGVASMCRHLERKGGHFCYSDYNNDWKLKRRDSISINDRIVDSAGWSELKALSIVFKGMPGNYNLFLSNGTCVRYAQLLMPNIPHGCYGNRGVSGIDGTNATALGCSIAYGGETLLITGDMSFAYCPEVLNLKRLGGRLRIVLVNNSGGGIFRFIETTRALPIREEYFCSENKLPVAELTKAYGWSYLQASNEQELTASLEKFWQTPFSLLEIKVEPQTSADTLIGYFGKG